MTTIGVIDDRDELRALLSKTIKLNLPNDWLVYDSRPLHELDQYPSWISANKVCALVLDEKLNEASSDDEGAVAYCGHDLVDFIRRRIPTLPIFVVTSYESDSDLQDRFKDVEDIISRTDFGRKSEDYVARMVRASQQYLETFETELAQLAAFAFKSATGDLLSDAEKTQALAIQQKIATAFSVASIDNKSQWLNAMHDTLEELEGLKQDMEKYLKGLNNDEMEKNS